MHGTPKIINTPADMRLTEMRRDEIVAAATIVVRYDDAVYPDNYDTTLKDGDDGYIAPDWRYEEQIDQSVLLRFGVVL